MTPNSQTLTPGLYVLATPIGNLGDITLRALETLKVVDAIACEDTRVTAKLLSRYGVKTHMTAYHEHNAEERRPGLLHDLQAGKTIALVSDAGTPLISDPGYKLVREALKLGISVRAIPGPSSVTAALSIAGLPTDRFLFAGFLPSKAVARSAAIEEIKAVPATLVLFESTHRLGETIAALAASMGDREAVVARELTKLHEELKRDTLSQLDAYYKQHGDPKGEVVIIIAPPGPQAAPSKTEIDAMLAEALTTLSVRDAAVQVAECTGLARQPLYARALQLKSKP